MTLPHPLHEPLFRLLASESGHAATLLIDCLPPEVAERLDPDHPPKRLEGPNIIRGGGAVKEATIFRLPMKESADAYVGALLWHYNVAGIRGPLQMYLADEVSLPPDRIETVMRRAGVNPEETEAKMEAAAELLEKVGFVMGKSEALDRLLRHRFGPLPDDIRRRVAQAGVEQLDRWLDNLVDAQSLDMVFAPHTKH